MLDDSFMAGNMTSAAASRIKAQRDRDALRVSTQKAELQPTANDLIKKITDEKANIADQIMALVTPGTSEAQANGIILAYSMYNNFLKGFESDVRVILRERPIKTEVSDEA